MNTHDFHCGSRVRIKSTIPVFGGRLGTVKGATAYGPNADDFYIAVDLDGGVPSIIYVEFHADELERLTREPDCVSM